jgi:cellulose synthase/poly-beta-1,6-N-acetylglucosamine synthase-like glycosyltransferase
VPTFTTQVEVDAKFFSVGGQRFHFRGVTYGTFLPREFDGALYPDPKQVAADVAAMATAGFTVVRTYTPPPDDLLDAAAAHGMLVLAGIFFPDWRYLVGTARREHRRVLAEAHRTVEAEVARLCGNPTVLAVCLGNEIPADVLRWVGTRTIARAIADLVDTVRAADADRLVTYANYPTAEYLPLDCLDFLTFNVFLERQDDFRRYLTRLQNLAGDRPLVLGEIGLAIADGDPKGELRQADFLGWQLETAMERGVAGTCVYAWTDEWAVGGVPVEGWQFGLTRADRSPRPALDVAKGWNAISIADLQDDWPSITVVICAYNAEDTLDECLSHTSALDYPGLEVIVVDDGSTDATADIAARHPRVQLHAIEHGGLSVARNEGFKAATGAIVAYLDADAYPSPEWPYYLSLAFDSRQVGGAGGPNVPPPADPIGAHRVAWSPGGPVHVLVADDRAEHVPGCNMAFWRDLLVEIGGFDPIYTSAGDDVDVCWKVLDRGWEIGFHPAALVWHHRRPGLRAYLKQQRGYGRSEALVEARHPDRFTPAGSARWHGRIYNPITSAFAGRRQRIYRGLFGAAPFQSVYQTPAHGLDLAHQLLVPLAVPLALTAPLAAIQSFFGAPAAIALLFLLGLFALDCSRTVPPRNLPQGRASFRASVALHHLLQPLVRSWSRLRARHDPHGEKLETPLLTPVVSGRHGTLLLGAVGPREEMAAGIVSHLRAAGLRTISANGWEDYDARLLGSMLVTGDVVTSGHPVGSVQLRVRRRVRWIPLGLLLVPTVLLGLAHPIALAAGALVIAASASRGIYRTGPLVRRTIREAAE